MASQKTYMPQSIQNQMQHELQRSLPAHLKEYATGNTYVPQHAQKALMQHMEKNLPTHLKQYASEFVRQQSASGALAFRNHEPRPVKPAAPIANPMRHDHSLGFGQQYNIDVNNPTNKGSLSYSPQYERPNDNAMTSAAPPTGNAYAPNGPTGSNYDFIMNSSSSHSSSWLVTASLKTRIVVASVGALVLLLIIWIGIALFTASASSNVQNFTVLAQEQAELMRISQDPVNNAATDTTQNFAQTTEFSLTSDQETFLAHLKALGSEPSNQVLAARHSSQVDAQLAAAKQAGTYDQTYLAIAQKDLNTYAAELKQAFAATSNLEERTLLNNAYQHAQLLITLSKQSS